MAIVLRFVDKEGYVQERFFDLIHVSDTTTLTLKNKIASVFLVIASTFSIFEIKDMTEQVIYEVSGMDYKH